MLLDHYVSAMDSWKGRIDSETDYDAFRWHQWVQPIDLNDGSAPFTGKLGFAFIGFCSDKGVARNKGRTGTALAPDFVRGQMSGLPCTFSQEVKLYDAGDIICDEISLDKGDKGKFTIVTDFVDIVDHPSLQFKMPLKIQWGWIFSDSSFKSSPVRLVNVKSHQIEFTPDGVRFTIEFADAKMFLEAEPSKFVGDKTDYLEVFNELAMGNMPMTVIDYSEKAGVHLEIRDNNPCDGKTEQREK